MSKKTIAIIGATGKMGSLISKRFANGNNRLLLFSHNSGKLNSLIKEIKKTYPLADLDGMGCEVDASWEADIIILTISSQLEKEVATRIRQVANQKIVISISNQSNKNYNGLITGTRTGEQLRKLLPGSKVVKLFNSPNSFEIVQSVIDGEEDW